MMRLNWNVGLVVCMGVCLHGCTVASLETSVQSGFSTITEPQTITTSFADTDKTVVLPDTFGDDKVFQDIDLTPRLGDGSLALRPGFYSVHVRSYCLHAGAAGPTKGEGYLYAPLKGPDTDVIGGILAGTYAHPQIPQRDVQTMIWAILARAKLGQLSSTMQLEAAQLLSPTQLAELETGGLPALEEQALQQLISSAPPAVREGLAFENRLRAALANASTSYADLERLAVPPPLPLTSDSVPLGRWSRHPGGYFVRYMPNSYTSMLVQVYVPTNISLRQESSSGYVSVALNTGPASVIFSLLGDVAVPASNGRQRLAGSNVPVASPPPPTAPPPPKPKPNCDKKASDYPVLNYGVPNGEIDSYSGHDPRIDIYAGARGVGTMDEPVFLSLRPTIDMDLVNGKGGTTISGAGEAQLTGATVIPEPWTPKFTQSGEQPGKDWGDVLAVKARYSYTKSDGTEGVLTFYLEYLHLITPNFPSVAGPMPCTGLGPQMTAGKKLTPDDLANRPLIGFEGAVTPPHVHVNARLVDGSSNSGLPNGPFVDPTLVLYGDN